MLENEIDVLSFVQYRIYYSIIIYIMYFQIQ